MKTVKFHCTNIYAKLALNRSRLIWKCCDLSTELRLSNADSVKNEFIKLNKTLIDTVQEARQMLLSITPDPNALPLGKCST